MSKKLINVNLFTFYCGNLCGVLFLLFFIGMLWISLLLCSCYCGCFVYVICYPEAFGIVAGNIFYKTKLKNIKLNVDFQ